MRLAVDKSDRVTQAKRAIRATFILNGLCWAPFIVRFPEFKHMLGVSNARFGQLLFLAALGLLLGMQPAGRLCARWGSGPVVLWSTALVPIGTLSFSRASTVIPFCVTLFIFAWVIAIQDVSMNAHGALLERVSQEPLMNGFHAWFSVGALIGGGYGAACVALNVSIFHQTIPGALLMWFLTSWMRKQLLDGDQDRHTASSDSPKRRLSLKHASLFIFLGLLGLAAAVCEGAASDWGAILARETFGASPFVASIPYICFQVAMVSGRFSGDRIISRLGREAIIRWGGLIAGIGLIVGLVIGGIGGVIFGWITLGLGVSIAIPTFFSASAEIANNDYADHFVPAQAVAVVTGLSYAGFLLGPPTVGALSELVTLRWAMLMPAVCILVMAGCARAIRPRSTD